MRKRWLAVLLAAAMILPAAQASAAGTAEIRVSFAPLHYLVDGTEYKPPEDQQGFIYVDKGRTYVPLRFVANILSKHVHWDPQTYTVTISDPHAKDWTEIRDYLETYRVEKSAIGPVPPGSVSIETITAHIADVTYVFNGQTVEADRDTPGMIYNDRIYVPLSFVYSSLGFQPKWDGETYAISTETDPGRLSYESIVKAADVKLRALENACKQEMVRWYVPFISKAGTLTEEQLDEEIGKVETIFKRCEADVRDVLDDLAFQLEEAGHSAAVVDEYWDIFHEMEQMGRNMLSDYLKQE